MQSILIVHFFLMSENLFSDVTTIEPVFPWLFKSELLDSFPTDGLPPGDSNGYVAFRKST